jgi:hypothetical protein
MRATPERQRVPESDDDREGDGDGPDDGSLDELLPPLDDESTHPSDDEPITDPAGLEPPSDPGAAEDDAPADLDLYPSIELGEEQPDDQGDTFGPADLQPDPGTLLDDDALPPGDERDGLDDRPVEVEEGELPDLDADDGEGDLDAGLFGGISVANEETLDSVEPAWSVTALNAHERCGALALGGPTVVAGSSDLLWLDPGGNAPVRLALDGTRITSLALLGATRQVALCVTAFGRLLRRARQSSDSERLTDWRRAADLGGGAESLELCQLEAEPSSVVARLTSGHLVRSDDLGASFYPLDPTFTAFALSTTGQPIALLGRDGAELGLSLDGGKTIRRRALPAEGREIAGGEAPFVAAFGDVVAIADSARGLAISATGGEAFQIVPGCSGVTAIAAGTVEERHAVWAALYRESEGRCDLVRILVDEGRAYVIASLRGTADDDLEGAPETRLDRLSWDGGRLFGAGAAGFFVIEPPKASAATVAGPA